MANYPYIYSIADDTLNGLLDAGKLEEEINDTDITAGMKDITSVGDDISIIFKQELSSEEVNILTTCVNNHDGNPILQPQAVRIQETSMAERQLFVKGVRFEAELDSVTQFDVQFLFDIELQIIDAFIENHTSGDYLEFSVHVPDSSDYQLSKFGETVYVPPSGEIKPTPSFDTSTIPAYIILRFSYTSVATNGAKPIIVAHMRAHR